MSLKGYCKECGNEIQNEDKMDTHDIWECDRCGYPHSDEDIFEHVPDYIDNEAQNHKDYTN